MDTGLDKNETELRVLVLSVALEMLADSDSLLDQHVKIFRDFWCEAVGLEDSENLVASNHLHLRNTVRISKNNTDLRWSSTLLRKLADLVHDLLRGGLEPRRRSPGVWDC